MSIIRAPRPESNFYLLDKAISEDKRLSWAAAGLLIYLLGKPDHWEVSVEHLRKEKAGCKRPTGRDGIYALLNELIECGYVVRQQRRGGDGQLGQTDYIVRETPLTEKPEAEPLPESPLPAEPYTAKPTQVSIEEQVSIDRSKKHTSSVDEGFALFWDAGMVKAGKKAAQAKFAALVKRQKADPLEFGRMLADDVRARMKAQVFGFDKLHPTTYLNQERWTDEIRPPDHAPAAQHQRPGRPAPRHTGLTATAEGFESMDGGMTFKI